MIVHNQQITCLLPPVTCLSYYTHSVLCSLYAVEIVIKFIIVTFLTASV